MGVLAKERAHASELASAQNKAPAARLFMLAARGLSTLRVNTFLPRRRAELLVVIHTHGSGYYYYAIWRAGARGSVHRFYCTFAVIAW